jgi:hypothetical protein
MAIHSSGRRLLLAVLLLVGLLAGASAGASAPASLALDTGTAVLGGNQLATAATFCVSAGTQTVTASADSYVSQANLGTNYGTATTLRVQAATSKNQRTLVSFSLPPAPAHCSLIGATLQLYTTTLKAGRTYQAWQIAASWSETGVTWANQPATTGTPANATTASGWVSWTVTGEVQAMYARSHFFGFLIKDATEDTPTTYLDVYSSRTGSHPPKLVLTWG